MSDFDAFNGDADGVCALVQLRLAEPRDATLITGVKRDISLVKRIEAGSGDRVTVLDVSLDKNRDDVLRLLDGGAQVHYVDHHYAGEIPDHPGLNAHINPASDVCTSLLVNGELKNAFVEWALVGAFGDNLSVSAHTLAKQTDLSANSLHQLDDLGIAVAMEEYVAAQRESAPFTISLDIAPELRHWRSLTDAMLFRILQEAVVNIRKHAKASQVSIALTPEPGGGARLSIEDNGCGFDPALARPGHFGLLTMRERAEALGGTLAVSSAPAQGTALVVTVPGEAGREKNLHLSDR